MDDIQAISTTSKILSDKVIEIISVMSLLIMILQTLVSAFKARLDFRVQMKMMERAQEENGMKAFLLATNQQKKTPLKWCLIFASLALSFTLIQHAPILGIPESDNVFLLIIFSLLSISFLAYYIILRLQPNKKE
ncbi:MAG: hypothetical protein JNN04_14065 [Cyclobacteriaceae bacterium]|nr:hypothetical protein [Cyclobacteriaceae bacterium]